MSEVKVEFLCPYCLWFVKGEVGQWEVGRYYTTCPRCGRLFPASIKVELDAAFTDAQLRRTQELWRGYCEFDGLGYLLKREHWPIVFKHDHDHKWWHDARDGGLGFALIAMITPVPMERRPPEPFWGALFLSVGDFKERKDTVDPDKVSRIYAVEDEREARFIRRALGGGG